MKGSNSRKRKGTSSEDVEEQNEVNAEMEDSTSRKRKSTSSAGVEQNEVKINQAKSFIDYSFVVDSADGDGNLMSCGSEISIDRVAEGFVPFPLLLTHEGLLKVVANDSDKKVIIYERKGNAFDKWLNKFCGTTGNSPILECRVGNGLNATYVPTFWRKFILHMLSTVCYVHENGYVFKNLTANNLCVKDNVVKFWRLELVKNEASSFEGETQKFNADSKEKRNFILLRRLIETIFRKSGKEKAAWPADLSDLLTQMNMSSTRVNKKDLLDHLALIPCRRRLSLVAELFEIKNAKDGLGEVIDEWDCAVSDFVRKCHLDDWINRKPIVGLIKDCYDFKGGKEYRVKKGGGVKEFDVAVDFLNLLRNLTHHVGQKTNSSGEVESIIPELKDTIIFWAFAGEIKLFRQCLKDYGVILKLE